MLASDVGVLLIEDTAVRLSLSTRRGTITCSARGHRGKGGKFFGRDHAAGFGSRETSPKIDYRTMAGSPL